MVQDLLPVPDGRIAGAYSTTVALCAPSNPCFQEAAASLESAISCLHALWRNRALRLPCRRLTDHLDCRHCAPLDLHPAAGADWRILCCTSGACCILRSRFGFARMLPTARQASLRHDGSLFADDEFRRSSYDSAPAALPNVSTTSGHDVSARTVSLCRDSYSRRFLGRFAQAPCVSFSN